MPTQSLWSSRLTVLTKTNWDSLSFSYPFLLNFHVVRMLSVQPLPPRAPTPPPQLIHPICLPPIICSWRETQYTFFTTTPLMSVNIYLHCAWGKRTPIAVSLSLVLTWFLCTTVWSIFDGLLTCFFVLHPHPTRSHETSSWAPSESVWILCTHTCVYKCLYTPLPFSEFSLCAHHSWLDHCLPTPLQYEK